MSDFPLSKRAALADPAKRTAMSLFKIIQFLFHRVPPEKKLEFFHRLKGKLTRISPGDVSQRKMSPSSTIGTSIGFAKNLLAGMDPNFVRQVMTELSFILGNVGLAQIKH